ATVLIVVWQLLLGHCQARQMLVTADRADGIYQPGDTVRWQVQWKGAESPPVANYTIKSGGLIDVARGSVNFARNIAKIESKIDAPGTMLLKIEWEPKSEKNRAFGGAVAAPQKIAPAAPPPEDFDEFLKSKLDESHQVPLNPQLEQVDEHAAGVS